MPQERKLVHAVEKALSESDATSQLKSVHVTAVAGVVFLDGEVSTAEEREAAMGVAKAVKGVRLVRNRLQVNPDARPGGWRAPHQHEE